MRPTRVPKPTLAVKDGKLSGQSAAGTVVEAINLSYRLKDQRIDHVDTEQVAVTKASGKYSGTLTDVRAGDVVRVRARGTGGRVSSWVTVRVPGKDVTPPKLWQQRINLVDSPRGVRLLPANSRGVVAEPGATVRIIHRDSGAYRDVGIDEDGFLPSGVILPGALGDWYDLAISDGTHDPCLTELAGSLRCWMHENGSAAEAGVVERVPSDRELRSVRKRTATGPVVIDGIAPQDVNQRAVGDCYLLAAVAATAAVRPEWLDDAVARDGKIGTRARYTTRMYRYEPNTKSFASFALPLTSELWFERKELRYGTGIESNGKGRELWLALLEKAYAAWKGDYGVIESDWPAHAFEALLGRRARYQRLARISTEDLWKRMQKAFRDRRPMTMTTHPKVSKSGVVPNHSYAILGIEVVDGQRLVKLRNPWGSTEPRGNGEDDGEFTWPIERVHELFTNFTEVL